MQELLTPRHPLDHCHQAQLESLALLSPADRPAVAQLLRFGNAAYCYYHFHEVEVTEADFLEWLEAVPARPQAALRALGFEENKRTLALRRYVLEKNDVGLSEYLRGVLSADDWQAYQQQAAAPYQPATPEILTLSPWLPPLT